jgi:uracil-DNA glycosylase
MSADKSHQAGLDFGDENAELNRVAARGLAAWNPQQWPVASDWQALVADFLASETARQLGAFIASSLARGALIFPPQPFWALELTPLARVKVLVLGQDPYHGAGQAQGLAFSVARHVKTPPSLRNILKEIDRDPHIRGEASLRQSGVSLEPWAQQGVLLLNTVLTVEAGLPASHAGLGWETLTDDIVRAVAKKAEPVVFMLWGRHAQNKISLIESVQNESDPGHANRHLILTANHPSPLSATRKPHPFVGCGHFSEANEFFSKNGLCAVDWSVGLRK